MRSSYLYSHAPCRIAPGTVRVFGAEPVVGGYWRVAYAIDGVVLEDYWRYLGRRWRFDLAQSNPGTVTFYRRSTAGYLAVVNCNEAT